MVRFGTNLMHILNSLDPDRYGCNLKLVIFKVISRRDISSILPKNYPQANATKPQRCSSLYLTHWGRVTLIYVSKITIIGSDNGLSPGRRQAIIWTNAGILLIGPLGTNFSEILMGIQTFSFKKMHLNVSSAKWRPFRLGLNVLTPCHQQYIPWNMYIVLLCFLLLCFLLLCFVLLWLWPMNGIYLKMVATLSRPQCVNSLWSNTITAPVQRPWKIWLKSNFMVCNVPTWLVVSPAICHQFTTAVLLGDNNKICMLF